MFAWEGFLLSFVLLGLLGVSDCEILVGCFSLDLVWLCALLGFLLVCV